MIGGGRGRGCGRVNFEPHQNIVVRTLVAHVQVRAGVAQFRAHIRRRRVSGGRAAVDHSARELRAHTTIAAAVRPTTARHSRAV